MFYIRVDNKNRWFKWIPAVQWALFRRRFEPLPSLTKRGLTLQVKNDNPSSREEKVAKQETVSSSQTLQEHSVDIDA